MKKILSIAIVTVLCFMLVGCGKKDEQAPINNVQNQQQENEYNEEVENLINQSNNNENKVEYAASGEKDIVGLTSTENRAVFNFNDQYYLVYEFDGEKVISLSYYYLFENEITASKMCQYFELGLENKEVNLPEIDVVKQDGKYVILEVNESVFASTTKTEIMEAYSYLQQLGETEE